MADEQKTSRQLLCPSSLCIDGAFLIGVIGSKGKVAAYLNPAPRIDKEFVKKAHQGRVPEQRFRFASPCQESACVHWTGNKCGIIDHAKSAAQETQTDIGTKKLLPKCAVRSKCRWFAQTGSDACHVCPHVFNYSP